MVREVHFSASDTSAVVERMVELAGGTGWLVLDPAVMSDDVPPPSTFGGLFSARGPAAPEVSWVPGAADKRRAEPLSVGIRHASGPKAVQRLSDAGHPVPQGWRMVQDNPKRGLVIQVPDDADHAEVLRWLLDAASVLATIPLTSNWRARIHLRV